MLSKYYITLYTFSIRYSTAELSILPFLDTTQNLSRLLQWDREVQNVVSIDKYECSNLKNNNNNYIVVFIL